MKTIKIFLASSEELAEERIQFGDFISQLDRLCKPRGLCLELIKWESLSKGYYGKPKQEEYNEQVRNCDLFVALFRTKAGKFTLEEFEVAKQTQKKFHKPILYVFCRELSIGEQEEPELIRFKDELRKNKGHYPIKYDGDDSLHLQFLMELLIVGNWQMEELKVENGEITFGGLSVANMDKLKFAAENEVYQKMKMELESFPTKIEKARNLADKYPEDEYPIEELQSLINRYNTLQKEFDSLQQNLFATAKRIAEMQIEKVSDDLRRAITEFECGRVEAANTILDGIEREADRHLEQLDRDRAMLHQDIRALQLKTKTLMVNLDIPIEQRIDSVLKTYQKAIDWAERSALSKEKYAKLLHEYGKFLFDYAKYDQALFVWQNAVQMDEELYGTDDPDTAASYYNVGLVYFSRGVYDMAMENQLKALEIRKKILGKNHILTALSFNDIGLVYRSLCEYDKALEYITKAMTIREKVLGLDHQDTAESYNCLGVIYYDQGDYNKALIYYQKALNIWEKTLGSEHRDTATSYHCIGMIYQGQGDYENALYHYQKASSILEKVLGIDHRDTAVSYICLGSIYKEIGDNDKALEYDLKALSVLEKVLGKNHPETASAYDFVGSIYDSQGDLNTALEYFQKALAIREQVLKADHSDFCSSYNNIGGVYLKQNQYEKALKYLQKALTIEEKVVGSAHPTIATLFDNIGSVYCSKGDDDKALEFLQKSLDIKLKVLGEDNPSTIQTKKLIDSIHESEEEIRKLVRNMCERFVNKIGGESTEQRIP